MRRERLQISTDLVAYIASVRSPVGTDKTEINQTVLHQMPACIVNDQSVRNLMLGKFPGREMRPLITWSCLVHPNMEINPSFVGLVDRRDCSAPVNGRQPSGIAMRENVQWTRGFLVPL